MRGISRLLLIFTIFLSVHGVFIQSAFSDGELLAQIETQITPESNNETIKKLQNLFKKLDLYDGEIDGNYKSIEDEIIDYQISSGIIQNKDSYGAGYFGKKTIKALRADYAEKFTTTAQQTISREEIELGERKFVVTAYYSPLPGQSKYVTGSYSRDIRLNGNGTHGASGVAVHPGFLAAPKNYNFGTKIYFEGLGVGVVQDRGGAIVNAGSRGHDYDRIDIWMGYGDEGRIRAMKWGKRTVSAEVLSDDSQITIAFNNSPINKYLELKVDGEKPNPENVKKLQELFSEIGKYNGKIDGKFDDIRDVLVDFQVKKSIISSSSHPEAGYFGPKTLAALREEYEQDIEYNNVNSGIELPELSSKQKIALDQIVKRIEGYIKKRSLGDDATYERLNEKLKDKIVSLIPKQTKSTRKLQLEYISSNL